MWSTGGRGSDRGNRLKLLDVCEPVLLTAAMRGGSRPAPGTGRHLHLVYTIDKGVFRPAASGLGGTPTDQSIEVEFDMMGPIHLNWPGSVYLTDGDPGEIYEIETAVQRSKELRTWHPLVTRVLGGTAVIPSHHSRIRATELVAYEVGNISGVLDHIPIPCTGDTAIKLGADASSIITEWWG